MRIYFDIIFVVLNVILFALNFHFALESKSSKSYTYAILGMTFAIAAIVLLLSTDSCTIKSIEDTQYKIEDCRPNGSDLPF